MKLSDLKIIITSATIDAERFANHFAGPDGPAPIVNVQGRGFPVEIRYLPWEEVTDDPTGQGGGRRYDLSQHVIAGIDAITRVGQGAAALRDEGATLCQLGRLLGVGVDREGPLQLENLLGRVATSHRGDSVGRARTA